MSHIAIKSLVSLTIVISAAAAQGAGLNQETAQSRPFVDQSYLIDVGADSNGVEVFFGRMNELSAPPRTMLYRILVGSDGSLGVPVATLIDRPSAGPFTAASSLVFWQSETGPLVTSRVADGRLKDPQGHLIAPSGGSPRLACGGPRCFAIWTTGGESFAAPLDDDGKPASGPFELPHSWQLLHSSADESGLFLVRYVSNEVWGTLIDFEGAIRYDTFLFATEPHSFPPHVASDSDGANHVVAWWVPSSSAILSAIITSDGTAVHTGRPLLTSGSDTMASPIAMAWNGQYHVLVGSMAKPGMNNIYALRLDRALSQLDAEPISGSWFVPFGTVPKVAPIGVNFAIGWSFYIPYIVLMDSLGVLSNPVPIHPPAPARRRSSRAKYE